MKKYKILLITFIAFSNVTFAQNLRTIQIDFSSKAIPTLNVNDIQHGAYYQIKINNINQNLYKVSLTSIDTVLSKPQQTPTFGDFNLDALSKVISGISSLSTSITQTESLQTITEAFSIVKSKDLFAAPVVAANKGIVDRMEQEKNALSLAKQSIEQITIRIDSLKLEVYKLKLNSYKISNPSSAFNFNHALTDLEKIRKDISDLKVVITTKMNSYEAFSISNKATIANNADLMSNDKSIKEAYEKFLSAIADSLTSISSDKANELLSSIVFVENNAGNIYTSMPIQYLGEQAKVQISITPREEKYNLHSYYTQLVFPQIIKPYTVVGLSFYGSSLYDKAYSTIKTKINDSTSNYKFLEENSSEAELGIAALLRYGKKWDNNNTFGTHLSIGAGISISNKIKPRFLFGGGLSFGKKHMLAFDFGGIVGYVDRLSNTIDLNKIYPEKPENITVSKIGIGAFISMGYIYQF